MNKLFTILLISLLISSVNAQISTSPTTSEKGLKTLTLEDAIIRRFTDFYPTGISGLRWYEDELIKISDDDKSILTIAQNGHKAYSLISISELNKVFDKAWETMPRISWSNNGQIYFSKDNSYYTYSLKSKKGTLLFSYPATAANSHFSIEKKAIAYTKDNNLYITTDHLNDHPITNHTDNNIVAGQAIARYEMGIVEGIFWSPKGRNIAFYQKDETAVTNYPLVDITTTPATLTDTKYPMAGQGSEYAQIGVYNIDKDKTIYLDTDGAERDQYLTNLTWGPNGKYIFVAVVNRDQNHVWLNKYDANTGKFIKTLFEEQNPRYVEPEHELYFIDGRENEFIWYSERDGFDHLYRYNTDGRLLNQVTKGKWAVLDIIGLDASKKYLLIKGTDESGINQILYRTKLDNNKSKGLCSSNGIHRYKLNKSGNRLIDDYSQLDNPREIDLITIKGKVKQTLLEVENPLKDYKVGSVELISFTSKSNVHIQGRMIKPSFFDSSKKYPVLVYLYGGPHAQMVTNRWLGGAPLWMIEAAERGYIVFTIDNRGSANRGFEFESIIHRQVGTVEMEDQLAGVDYLKALPYIDIDKMAIHGWSYGGFMTTTMMLRAPGTFKVGVAGGPVTDWRYYEVMYGERYMDTPQSNPEGYETNTLKNYVTNLKGKLLLIHGSIDPTVVPQHSLSLIQAFVDNGVQMDFYTYPMHPHNVRGKDRLHLMTKVLNYIDDVLMPCKK